MSHDPRTKALVIAALDAGCTLGVWSPSPGASEYTAGAIVRTNAHGEPIREIKGKGPDGLTALTMAAEAQGIKPDPALMALEAENEAQLAELKAKDRQIAYLERLLTKTAKALFAVRENDASPRYDYRGKGSIRPLDGTKPPKGERWNTPLEIVDGLQSDPDYAPYFDAAKAALQQGREEGKRA